VLFFRIVSRVAVRRRYDAMLPTSLRSFALFVIGWAAGEMVSVALAGAGDSLSRVS